MTDEMMTVYDPTATPRASGASLAERPLELAGKTIGILDNGKANAGVLMGAMVDLLKQQYGVSGVIIRKKPVAGPAPAQAIADFKKECAAVLVGSAD